MKKTPYILCIGSVMWDVIGRATIVMRQGSDVPGRIERLPGGVAMNIAMALGRMGLKPSVLTAIGRDMEGDDLLATCQRLGIDTTHVYRSHDLPTDQYMAVEGANGLIAAIADALSLETAGDKILQPLLNGPLGSGTAPYEGLIALDGNLTHSLLENIATHTAFALADLRVAPASPGKAERLQPFLRHSRAVLYVNLEEAGLLCQQSFDCSAKAAAALVRHGAARALVTNGANPASDGCSQGVISAPPPEVLVTRITGAGDTFMAAHMAAERVGLPREQALQRALVIAATYVSGEQPA
ncbi:PfkB family carbohydrate kinase [Thalassovita gelatinovora]|uniref:PfkB family carbohydrate kinase n=2 Tax=Thalassovita gelatinovora TaxID=53501 RepID=UPI00094456F7|nr:PfkB family carbohydrate kinase [Thalassovita gelatinovora]QIZ79477.1 kinase [Thalassovita gelatinovora]